MQSCQQDELRWLSDRITITLRTANYPAFKIFHEGTQATSDNEANRMRPTLLMAAKARTWSGSALRSWSIRQAWLRLCCKACAPCQSFALGILWVTSSSGWGLAETVR